MCRRGKEGYFMYLLNTYYMSGIVADARERGVNDVNSWSLHSRKGGGLTISTIKYTGC